MNNVTFIQFKRFNHQERLELQQNPQDIYHWACGYTVDKDGKPISFDPSRDALEKFKAIELVCNKHHHWRSGSPYSRYADRLHLSDMDMNLKRSKGLRSRI
jgi:hypothetical protein